MTESDKNQQEIKNILACHKELDYAWLASKTGQTYDHVYYALVTSSILPMEDYFSYKLAFEKHGYSKNSAEYCKDILPAALITNSKVNDGLKKINEAVAEATADGKYDPDERYSTRVRLVDLKKTLNQEIDRLIAILDESGK